MATDPNRKEHHAPLPPDHPKDMASWKPGSEGEEAANVVSKGDFGVHASKATRGERDYTSRNTKQSDPGNAQAWSRENEEGDRTSGAGAHDSGFGSSSAGDIDPDIVGVGTGGSVISQSGPSRRQGADQTDGTSKEFASGGPATGRVPDNADDFRGSTFTGDPEADARAAGADVATSAFRDDDSFAGEISSGEAAGDDNEMGPKTDS